MASPSISTIRRLVLSVLCVASAAVGFVVPLPAARPRFRPSTSPPPASLGNDDDDYNNKLQQPFLQLRTSHLYSHQESTARSSDNYLDGDSTSGASSISTSIQVFDNAFGLPACQRLHDLSEEHQDRTNNGSSIFTRPPHNTQPLTPLEQAIHGALLAMENTEATEDDVAEEECKVEYWSRSEYMNLDLHADIDEGMLDDEEGLRSPTTGHVLYLLVQPQLHGPTCVFPQKLLGWEAEIQDASFTKSTTSTTPMAIVPAVSGRILRFPGSAMHAVPKPPTRWLHSPLEQKQLTLQEKEEDEDDWYDDEDDDYLDDDDDDDDYYNQVERSVILFNTWPAHKGPPPRGVDPDYATGGLPDGIELSDSEKDAFQNQMVAEWEQEYDTVKCNPCDQWSLVDLAEVNSKDDDLEDPSPISDGSDDSMTQVHVSLMGKPNRRLHPHKYATLLVEKNSQSAANLISNVEALALALEEPTKPSLVHFQKP